MELGLKLVFGIIIAVGFDWLFCGRLSALAPSIRYRYKPTAWRYAALFGSATCIAFAKQLALYWNGFSLVTGVVLLAYAGSAVRDVFAQRADSDSGAFNKYDF